MLNISLKCKTCGNPLVDGTDTERHGGNNRFKCIVKGIPTKVCSRGCPGAYWYWLDFGVEVLGALGPDSPNIAKRRLGLFRNRHLCPLCNAELTDKGESAQFVFHQKLRKGTHLEMVLEAPCLECMRCGSRYLPSQTSSHDPYYTEIANVVSTVITKDLIWK